MTYCPANIALRIAYDGTLYKGWQDNNKHRSIEKELRTVLEKILRHQVKLEASSRTDAGVHAEEQIVRFYTPKQKLDTEKLRHSIHALLPDDIAVISVEKKPFLFHPTTDSYGKTYHYYLCTSNVQLPHFRHYSWHVPQMKDIDLLMQAASYFEGEHDFAAFCGQLSLQSYTCTRRYLSRIELIPLPDDRFRIEIEGEKFLYKMVRNLVGTMVDIARGRLCIDDIEEILSSKLRSKAGVCAPAHGLFLHKIHYNPLFR